MAHPLEYDTVSVTSVTRGGMTCESGLRGGMTCMDHRGMIRPIFTMKNILNFLKNIDFLRSKFFIVQITQKTLSDHFWVRKNS